MIVRCPDCKRGHYVTIDRAKYASPAAWIAERSPHTKPGEVPEQQCFGCWKAASTVPDVQSTPAPPSATASR